MCGCGLALFQGSSPQLLFQCDKNWEVEPGNETKGWLGGMGLYVATYFYQCLHKATVSVATGL